MTLSIIYPFAMIEAMVNPRNAFFGPPHSTPAFQGVFRSVHKQIPVGLKWQSTADQHINDE